MLNSKGKLISFFNTSDVRWIIKINLSVSQTCIIYFKMSEMFIKLSYFIMKGYPFLIYLL